MESLKNPYGVDSGVVCTVATSTGIACTSPNEARLNARIKKAQRQLARKTGAAVRLGLAGYQARLDPYNRQVISDQGRPTFLLVWQEGQPTAAYTKARRQLQNLYQKRNALRHQFRHRATSALAADAVAQGHDLLVSEDLRIANMVSSARGTVHNPGRNVKAKAGLNRVILQQGWATSSICSTTKPRKPVSDISGCTPPEPPRPATAAASKTPNPGAPRLNSTAPPAATRPTPTTTPRSTLQTAAGTTYRNI